MTKEATCGEPGVMTYTCTLCGATYTKAIPATGAHTWDGGRVVREATCTIPGKITYTCKVCGAVKSELIPELGHKPVLKNAVKATQTMAGYSGDLVCSVCGTVLELGHRISPVGELNPWTLTGGIPKIPKQEEPKAEEPKPVVKEVKEEEDALPFKDVAKTDSFYDDVKFVFENGIMNGVSATEFAPFSTLTRAMIVIILYRVEGEPLIPYTGAFADVEDGTWYTYGVEWAAANGIVNGYDEGKYGPNDAVTLEQLAAILNRYAVFKGYKIRHATA